MLHCFSFIIFHWPIIKKILIARRKCYSCNTQVSEFMDVWWLHAAIPCACVKLKFQFTIRWNWKSSKRHASSYSIVFGSLQSLPCIFCTNQTKNPALHLIVSSSEQTKTFFHLNFLFLPFKLFISSWSLWSNSTHPDESSWLENSKACRRTKYGNWIQSQAGVNTNVESQKLEIHCMTGRKVKFTRNG